MVQHDRFGRLDELIERRSLHGIVRPALGQTAGEGVELAERGVPLENFPAELGQHGLVHQVGHRGLGRVVQLPDGDGEHPDVRFRRVLVVEHGFVRQPAQGNHLVLVDEVVVAERMLIHAKASDFHSDL